MYHVIYDVHADCIYVMSEDDVNSVRFSLEILATFKTEAEAEAWIAN